ncbi:hypothetical protein BN1723_006890 [Verticillium longisporum]|uniref:Uncharacterized protein n=1 Tax=Verticillium longisporum TaxID=100787 RepID=A0A0G4NI98_VERLO|nr:hypothetical protein BN1723_006890 [Verticillium longisporum]
MATTNPADFGDVPPQYIHRLDNGSYVFMGMFNTYGPGANCTLDLCPIEWTVYQYRPILGVSIMFIILYFLALLVHVYLGFRWRTWWFASFMAAGCLAEVVGYIGRVLLYNNPWSFGAFLIQIVFITFGPVFFTAAIYVTLARAIVFFAPDISRIRPRLLWIFFITADILCLVLQAAGGAISSISAGSNNIGVDIALAGLILQVVLLFAFCVFFGDYMWRYIRSVKPDASRAIGRRQRLFFGGLAAAIVLIFVRCVYRVDELSEGYQNSTKITNEGLFIGLEGVLIVQAACALFIGHPGYGLEGKVVSEGRTKEAANVESGLQSESTKETPSER